MDNEKKGVSLKEDIGVRTFIDPENEDIKYHIVSPTADDIRGADWQYSKVYTKSLVEGITTSAEMMDILMRRGIVGPEFEQRQRELSDNLATKVLELQTSNDMDKKQLLAMSVASARDELFNWNQRLNGPMSHTCEQMADDSRLEYLTACMVEHADGSKLWDSYDKFLKERSQSLAVRARFEIMLYLQGLSSNFLSQTPEAIAMKEVEDELKIKASKAIEDLSKQQKEVEESSESKDKSVKTTRKTSTTRKTTKKKSDSNKV